MAFDGGRKDVTGRKESQTTGAIGAGGRRAEGNYFESHIPLFFVVLELRLQGRLPRWCVSPQDRSVSAPYRT